MTEFPLRELAVFDLRTREARRWICLFGVEAVVVEESKISRSNDYCLTGAGIT
jgi:hypothetical protein